MCIWVFGRVRVSVQVRWWGWYAGCGRVSIHLARHHSDVFGVAVVCVDAVRRVAACVSQPLAARVALAIVEHLTVRVWEDGVILPVCRLPLYASIVVASPVHVYLCGLFVAAEVLTVREKSRVVPYSCYVHIIPVFSWHKASCVTALPLPLAKIVGVSVVCLERLLHVCSVAVSEWLRCSPPEHRKKRGRAARWSWRLLQLLRWGITYSYLIKTRQGGGLIRCRPVCGCAMCRVGTCHL